MSKNKRKREIIPAWDMPSDPVKAVWWFMHWLLRVLVRFFWVPILVLVVYEVATNLSVSGIGVALIEGGIALLVGVVVWGVLYAMLALIKISVGIRQAMSDVERFQRQSTLYQRSFSPFMEAMHANAEANSDEQVVEGTITDLEEERNKRRRE